MEYRLTGYKRALTKAKIPFDDALVYEAGYSYDAGRKLQPVIADSGATAVFVGDDEMAAGLINASMESGINVPDDLEVVTSNDTIITQITRPAITSITQPLYDIGAVAMRMLTKLMNDKELDEKTVTLPYGIVRRGSTKSAD